MDSACTRCSTSQHSSQSRKYLTTTQPGFCLAVPLVDDASWSFLVEWDSLCRAVAHVGIRLDSAALGWFEGVGLCESPLRALVGAAGGSVDWTAPAARMTAETTGRHGKNVQVCLTLSDGRGGIQGHAPYCCGRYALHHLASRGVADDREMIVRSAERGTPRSGGSSRAWAYSRSRAQDRRYPGFWSWWVDLCMRKG